jgi:hypothetical protein
VTATLAIVIPAYKARYLNETLASIARQDTRGFLVIVGDDASPEDLGSICRHWSGALNLRYHRFASNLGSVDLVQQWARCLTLCDESWVWLFGDDDLMPADAAGRALAAAREEGEGGSLLHFDVQWIDALGRVSRVDRPFPPRLCARGFAHHRLRFELESFASEYVFSRQALERAGGFVSFPSGWCADDATWLRLAAPRGIRTLPGSRVGWRHSGLNISSRHGSDAAAKFQALLRYVGWLQDFLAMHPAAAGEPKDIDILRWVPTWLQLQAGRLGVPRDDIARAQASLVAQGLPTVGAVARWADALDAGARRARHALGRRLALGGRFIDGAGPAPVDGQAPAKGGAVTGAGH